MEIFFGISRKVADIFAKLKKVSEVKALSKVFLHQFDIMFSIVLNVRKRKKKRWLTVMGQQFGIV